MISRFDVLYGPHEGARAEGHEGRLGRRAWPETPLPADPVGASCRRPAPGRVDVIAVVSPLRAVLVGIQRDLGAA